MKSLYIVPLGVFLALGSGCRQDRISFSANGDVYIESTIVVSKEAGLTTADINEVFIPVIAELEEDGWQLDSKLENEKPYTLNVKGHAKLKDIVGRYGFGYGDLYKISKLDEKLYEVKIGSFDDPSLDAEHSVQIKKGFFQADAAVKKKTGDSVDKVNLKNGSLIFTVNLD